MKASGVGIVATILAGVCFGAGGTSTPTGFTDDFDAALKASAASSRPVIAVFSGSDWCGWCMKLEKEVFSQDEFLKDATNRYTLVYIDSPQKKSLLSATAVKRNPELVKKYAIQGFPTVLVLDAQGAVLGKTGYRRGGGVSYLKHLDGIVANGPLVAKHLKPYRDEFEKLTAAFEVEAEKILKDVPRTNKVAVAAAKEKLKALAPDYGARAKAIRRRFCAETIPAALAEEEDELLDDIQSFIQALRLVMAEEEEPEDETSDEREDEQEVGQAEPPPPADGKWHGIAYAGQWADAIKTNAALPTAWKYFTGQFRPYVRRQLPIPADDPFATEAKTLVDEIARTLWTPINKSCSQWVLKRDFERVQALRDRGCSNLTVRALASAADFNRYMAKHGSISNKGPESDPYRAMARELEANGTPLLRRLYAAQLGLVPDCGCGDVTAAFVADVKAHPQDLRVIFNLFGSYEAAKAFDPFFFGLMADALGERNAAEKTHGEEHLVKAKVLLEKAYELHPELPEVSGAMMEIVALQGDGQEKDLWFSRVLEREVDNRDAWNTYVFHALPRWGGTVEGLRGLSDALGRIDNAELAYLRFQSAQLLVSVDMETTNSVSFFLDPALRERYLSACRQVAGGEGVDDETAFFARKGIVDRYWEVGEYEAAGKAYEEWLAHAPYRFRSLGESWGEPFEVAIPALSGSHAKELAALEKCYQAKIAEVKTPSKEALDEARGLLKPLLDALDGLTTAEKKLVYLRKSQLGIEDATATDEAWHALPVEEGFPGWERNVCFKYADRAYRITSARSMLSWRSPLPADYELEIDVAFASAVDVGLDDRLAPEVDGASFGCPCLGVRRIGNAKSGWKARVDLYSGLWEWRTRSKRQLSVEVPLKGEPDERHKIAITVHGGAVSVRLDGVKVLESDEGFKRHFVVPRDNSKIKVGSSKVSIYGLRYRRLCRSLDPCGD